MVCVDQYGADPTGTVDSTAAIQAAVDDVCRGGDVRRAVAPVVLGGQYRITESIRVRSVMGFQLLGLGGARLLAAADMASVLDLNGVTYSQFGGFEVSGVGSFAGPTVQRVIHLYWDQPTASRSTTLNSFHGIHIHALNYITGIELGRTDDGNQVDNTTLRDVSIVGAYDYEQTDLFQHGLVVGDGRHANNLIHNAYGLHVDHHRYNVDVRTSQFGWFGGHAGGAETDIRWSGTSYLRVEGVRSENSRRLLATSGPAGFASMATLEDIAWRAEDIATDGKLIRWNYGGVLRLNNLHIARPAVPPIIAMEGAGAPSALLADGVTVTGGGIADAASLFATTASSRVQARGVTLTDSAGAVTSVSDYDSAP